MEQRKNLPSLSSRSTFNTKKSVNSKNTIPKQNDDKNQHFIKKTFAPVLSVAAPVIPQNNDTPNNPTTNKQPKKPFMNPNTKKFRTPITIQSSSVFSSGFSVENKPEIRSYSSNSAAISEYNSTSNNTTKHLKFQEETTIDVKNLKILLDNEEDDYDEDKTEETPITLPLESKFTQIELEDNKNSKMVNKPVANQKNISNILLKSLESSKESVVLIHLPDCLPVEKLNQKEEQIKQEQAPINPDNMVNIKDVEDGQLGKIQLFKSGKARLIVDDYAFELYLGSNCNFLQEIVYCNIDEEEPYFMNLANVVHRFVCVPDMDELLASCSTVI